MKRALTPEAAATFAQHWVEAWNARDLERILSHYSWDIDFASPFVEPLFGGPTDHLLGIASLRSYFRRALDRYPDLRFTLRRVYSGVQSLVLEYQSVSNYAAAEVMEFNEARLICRVRAHYSAEDSALTPIPPTSGC